MVRARTNTSGHRGANRAQRFTSDAGDWSYRGRNTFGSFLREQRVRKGYTRQALAVATGIEEKRLIAIECGAAMPSIPSIRSLGGVLGIPEGELLAVAGYIKQG